MAVKLTFSRQTEATPGAVKLVFAEGTVRPVVIEGVFNAVLPAVPAPGLGLSAEGVLDMALPDADGVGMQTRQQTALPLPVGLTVWQQMMQACRTALAMRQQNALPLPAGLVLGHQGALWMREGFAFGHQTTLQLGAGLALGHQQTVWVREGFVFRHQTAVPLGGGLALGHQQTVWIRDGFAFGHQTATPLLTGVSVLMRPGLPLAIPLRLPHQTMIPLPIGWSEATYPWPKPPAPKYSGPVRLKFCRLVSSTPGDVKLVFACGGGGSGGETIVIPVQGVYVIVNDFELIVVNSGQRLNPLSFSAGIDANSWVWSFQCSLPGAEFDAVFSLSDPVLLEASINGQKLRVLAEQVTRGRQFPATTVSVSGRGIAAQLDAPYSPQMVWSNTDGRNVSQLLSDALMVNGVPLGWDVDWQAADWYVPAGVWSHSGTWISAAMRLAEAAGAYVQGHDTEQKLVIFPRYPAMPWDWGMVTPAIVLPEDVCTTESIEYVTQPDYNVVYVAGGEGGRLDRVRRSGTAADKAAPTIVDALATSEVMTRARGSALLGDTGRQARITLRLPVQADWGGIIKPGVFIQYSAEGRQRIGLSRGVSIEQGWPALYQSVVLETHL